LLSSLSIGVACYNDAPTIAAVVADARETAARLAHRYQVLVIDDGSSDLSPSILRDLSLGNEWLECRYHATNRGFGATFGALYGNLACDYNAILAGDGQIPAAQLDRLVPHLGPWDMVVGWRTTRADSLRRRINSALYNGVISLLVGRRVRDVNSISLASTSLTRRFSLSSRSAFVHAEFFLKCLRHGGKVTEVPIEHSPRRHGSGAGGSPAVVVSTLRELVAYVLRDHIVKSP
jgi:glycosyltransferase involved in cell wall biosynthesis